MRIKNTLFTAITAGIIFLSGVVILGKNTLLKRCTAQKDYIALQPEQSENTKETLKQEELTLATKEEANIEIANMERNNEKVILLQKVNQLVQSRQTGKINYTVNKLARKYEGKRVEEELTLAERSMLTYQEKMGYKIREPSSIKIQKSSLEITNKDKGG